jgi:DNA-binding winged helix-turn-helix (wHTH) protein
VLPSPQWRFDLFRLDPDDARLWRGNQSIPLTLKAVGVLHYLVSHAGQLVTKEALLDALWPNTAVSDAALRVVISELRKALGDTAQAPQFIVTVHRLGYRFLAPVTRIESPVKGLETGYPPFAASSSPEDRRLGERMLVTVLGGVLLNAGALGAEVGLDDLHRLMHLVSDIPLGEVRQCEGMIQHVIGGGFLALFGVPLVQEDHVQRPLLADLGLQERLHEREQRLCRRCGELLGLHSGFFEGELSRTTLSR